MSSAFTRSELLQRLRSTGFQPSKTLGQNFLADMNIARKICEAAAAGTAVRALEIGPGFGSLTLPLATYFETVVAVETDRMLVDELQKLLTERGIANVELIRADVLKLDFERLGVARLPTVAVGNLPYNIASQIILRTLESAWFVEQMVFMVQAELADRLLAPIPSRQASAFGVRVALLASVATVAKVPPSVFVPEPKVSSKVISLTRIEDPLSVIDPALYRATVAAVRLGFGRRRQMLRRIFDGEAAAALRLSGIDPQSRAENLAVPEWIALGQAMIDEGLLLAD